MNTLRRAARIVADEGVSSLMRRIGTRLLGPGRPVEVVPAPITPEPPDVRIESARQEHGRLADSFRKHPRTRGHAGLEHFYWYHTVDLGGGLVTPGDYDFRGQWQAFDFPEDLTGMRVLDVGSATGFFAFEFERRGAEVVSVELPSLADWDILAAEREDVIRGLKAWLRTDCDEEAYRRHLEGPFRFCHQALGSRVKRCYSSVYDLTLAKVGGERFDLVYVGDVLLHLFSPLKALDVLAGLCRGSLVATVDLPFFGPTPHPLMAFRGNASKETDRRTWWMPNAACVSDMLSRLGFGSVSVVGRYEGVIRRVWLPFEREVIRATKG